MAKLRLLLLPFSWLYSIVLWFRHQFYDLGILQASGHFGVPVICIGNLNLGGTGKTPFTEYLIEKLSNQYNIGVISRGYGRSTKGYLLASPTSTAKEIGDEPLQIYSKNQHRIVLAVCEDRTTGIKQLLKDKPNITLIILDDAFQHRKVRADINILLTPYNEPYFTDHLLPAGNLRDIKSVAKRADHLIFTKSPQETNDQKKLQNQLPGHLKQDSWFSRIDYLNWKGAFTNQDLSQLPGNIYVVSGIAKPSYLIDHVKAIIHKGSRDGKLLVKSYPDHHKYTATDLSEIASTFDTFASAEKAILTTEKDWVKLAPLLEDHPDRYYWIVAPIAFQLEQEDAFLASLKHKIAATAAH